MSVSPESLLARLEAIGQSLAASRRGLALLGLGSVGLEVARLDAYSDLDFFAIVQPGHKADFLDDLTWLERVHPLAYHFQNTVDGHKALFADGIFCEFAIFEPHELATIPFAPGRIVWQAPDFDPHLAAPQQASAPPAPDLTWQVGECLTNLYVGLSRLGRGETLSAMRFIQVYALDRLIVIMTQLEGDSVGLADPFTPERRIEARYPALADQWGELAQGYSRNKESARAILACLERYVEVNAALKAEIIRLSQP